MKYLCMLIILCASNTVFAQGHNHSDAEGKAETHQEPPHGGELMDIGKYKLEVVLDVMAMEEKFNVYLFKSNMKAIDMNEVAGSVTFRYKDGREILCDLKKANSEKLYCNIEDITNEFFVTITIRYKGKEYRSVCEYMGLKEHLEKKKVK